MVDVVVNHFGWNGAPTSVDYSDFTPFNTQSNFHPYCAIDYSDTSNTVCYPSLILCHRQPASSKSGAVGRECGEESLLTCAQTNIEQCWEGDTNVCLPDLRTEDSDVASTWNTWISGIISEYSIDGLRMDSALEVDTAFWAGFGSAAGVYFVGEVDNSDAGLVCSFQDYLPGVLNYGT